MTKARACDRCSAGKTQCDRSLPCARCLRLRLDCSYDRPRRKRGRPNKTAAAEQETDSLPSESGDVELPDGQTSQTEEETTRHLREERVRQQFLPPSWSPASFIGDDGITSAFSPHAGGLVDDFGTPILSGSIGVGRRRSGRGTLPPDLSSLDVLSAAQAQEVSVGFMSLLSLLTSELRQGSVVDGIKSAVMALLLQMNKFSSDQTQSDEFRLLKDSCRIEALACVPAITWTSREWRVAHVVILTLFSFTWCLHSFLTEMACRWNYLADMIWTDLRNATTAITLEEGLRNRLDLIISLQTQTLRLLTNSRSTQAFTAGELQLHHLPGQLPLTSPAAHSISASAIDFDDFGDLFQPLIEPLGLALSMDSSHNSNKSRIRDLLEVYYINFPPRQLAFSAINQVHRAEAMIWVHGIHILAESGPDLIDMLFDVTLPSQAVFYTCFEHAILLSEVLPTILRLDAELKHISPATVYFLSQASIVLAVALMQFHTAIASSKRTRLVSETPERLLQLIESHRHALGILTASDSRCDSPIVTSLLEIVSILQTDIAGSAAEESLSRAVVALTHYRWRGKGRGIIALSETATIEAWNHSGIELNDKLTLPFNDGLDDTGNRREWISQLTSQENRICKPGYFDLSIRFL